MTQHLSLGIRGEDLVEHQLRSQGFTIHERNWRGGGGELDLVCSRDELLVFVEVRTRATRFLASPLMTINGPKQSRIAKAASCWLMNRAHRFQHIRFDVFGVILTETETVIEHIENAFVPSWAY